MSPLTRLLVNRRQIADARIDTAASAALSAGQVRFRIDSVALTANTISYAATGDVLQYWQFFPVDAEWGSVPSWGFATAAESLHPGLPVGTRIWGFLPLASELVMEPAQLTNSGFTDCVAHRRALPYVYNEYTLCNTDPMHTDGQEDIEALLRPLFSTAWLVDDFVADNDCFGARTMVLSSASSKTAYGTALRLSHRDGLHVVGLTAARNVEFVRSLGCYHQVLSYDQIHQLDAQAPSVYLDYAGNSELRRAVHHQVEQLRYSCSIGGSHADKVNGNAPGLPGPKPIFLFLPKQAAKRAGEWGLAGLMQRMGSDWRAFVVRALDPDRPWVVVQQHSGASAVLQAYAHVLEGRGDPRAGHMVSFHGARVNP